MAGWLILSAGQPLLGQPSAGQPPAGQLPMPQPTRPDPLFLDRPLSAWLLDLRSAEASKRKAAVFAVSKLHLAGHLVEVSQRLTDPDAEVRSAAADALAALGPLLPAEQVKQLALRFAEEPRPSVQRAIVQALARSEQRSADAIHVIKLGLQHSDASVIAEAIQLFGQWGTAAPEEYLPMVAALARHDDEAVRAAVAWAMGRIGPIAKDHLSLLQQALEDNATSVREQALISLRQLGPLADRAVPNLSRFLHLPQRSEAERRGAWLALIHLGPTAVFQLDGEWAAVFQETDGRLRAAAAQALLPLFRQGQGWRLLPTLWRAMKDESIQVRCLAGWGLFYLSQHVVGQGIDCLRNGLRSPKPTRAPRR